MLHEILLSLSGLPSPLLGHDHTGSAIVSAPEKELLKTAGHLSHLHRELISNTAQITASHPSAICRAVSSAIASVHLAAFQRKILEVEDSILRKDAALVGAYNIVPLTAVLSEFSGWTRRLEWLRDIVQFISQDLEKTPCTSAQIIDRLRDELATGYADIEEVDRSLVKIAETAWLKQISAWILYGRLPTSNGNDFFVRRNDDEEQGYSVQHNLLPSFVSSSTASSMLFVGVSLIRVRVRNGIDTGGESLNRLPIQLQALAQLTFPLHGAIFSRVIASIRLTLSRTTLQKLLPLPRVLEILTLLRHFFLLGRGEFAMALTQQADERIRNRWRRAENLAYERRDAPANIVVKEGEVAAVLNRTWAVLGSMQGQHADEDEGIEMARDLIKLTLSKSSTTATPMKGKEDTAQRPTGKMAHTPFRNLLFSAPTILTLQTPSPLDLFLSSNDLQTYSMINAYLLSIRRAHLRLTDLWKITSLRRHHLAPPRPPFSTTRVGIARTRLLRERSSARSSTMLSAWSTSSAAIFFLAETEAYLQVEVVGGLWEHFHDWLTGDDKAASRPATSHRVETTHGTGINSQRDKCIASRPLTFASDLSQRHRTPDPQTLATAHRIYLSTLTRRLLLSQPNFTQPLYDLLIHIDHLVALIHRLDTMWKAQDLEADEGVVDAFSNLEAEERDVLKSMGGVEGRVKGGIENVVDVLRGLSMDSAFMAKIEDIDGSDGEGFRDGEGADGGIRYYDEVLVMDEEDRYRPRRVGGIDRLLMKLDFGGWLGASSSAGGH